MVFLFECIPKEILQNEKTFYSQLFNGTSDGLQAFYLSKISKS